MNNEKDESSVTLIMLEYGMRIFSVNMFKHD